VSGAWTIRKPTACGVEHGRGARLTGSRHRSGDAGRKAGERYRCGLQLHPHAQANPWNLHRNRRRRPTSPERTFLAHLVRFQGPNLVTIGTRDGTQVVRTNHSHRDRAVVAARPPRDARHRRTRLDTAAAAEILDAAVRGEAAKTAGEATSMIVTRKRAGFRSVLCPIDFSEHSRRALEYGAAVALDARAALHDARPVAAVDGAVLANPRRGRAQPLRPRPR
jgi:hypothetical protein